MNIISIINYQLAKIEELLTQDYESKGLTYNYLICEDECKFLDKYGLQNYLIETKIENTHFLKLINIRCLNIIKLWNIKLDGLPTKIIPDGFSVMNEKKVKYFQTTMEFHAIYLEQDRFSFFSPYEGQKIFIEGYKYKIYTIADIAARCNLMLSWILEAFPETKITIDPNLFYHKYISGNGFLLSGSISVFNTQDFEKIKINIKEYELRFWYIFNKLEEKKKKEFRDETIRHLKDVLKAQEEQKYIDLINILIAQIEESNQELELNATKLNHFNEEGFELFKHLIANYKKTGIVKYIYIYTFLMKNNPKPSKYHFFFKQKEYTDFIFESFQIKIKKYQISEDRYDHYELLTLNRIAESFNP